MTAQITPKPYIPMSHVLDPRGERDRLGFLVLDKYLERSQRKEVVKVETTTIEDGRTGAINHYLAAYDKNLKLLMHVINQVPSGKITHRDHLVVSLIFADQKNIRRYGPQFA
jgi:hypothetical protein